MAYTTLLCVEFVGSGLSLMKDEVWVVVKAFKFLAHVLAVEWERVISNSRPMWLLRGWADCDMSRSVSAKFGILGIYVYIHSIPISPLATYECN